MFHGLLPSHLTYFMNLPLTRLHVLQTGRGTPLIMVPATVSELENWLPLAQFMAHWFRVYFFELPGHGLSEPFAEGFSSHLVARLVGQMADALGFERFSLMGFSFGGILAMRTFKHLSTRIDRLVLIAPCLSYRALPFSSLRLYLLRKLNQLLGHPKLQARFVDLIHDQRTVSVSARVLKKIGRLEDTIPLGQKLLRTSAGTVSVLHAQVHEILTTHFDSAPARHETPCYFAMSIYDPLLHFDITEQIVHDHFASVRTVRLTYPFHQPPVPFTYEELNRDFYATVDAFMRSEA